jgi:hypothetical protein
MVRMTLIISLDFEYPSFDTLCLYRPTWGRSMKARQHLQGLAFLTLVLLVPAVGFLSIVSIPIVDEAVGGLIGSPAQAAKETPRDMLAAQIRMQGVACDKPLSAVRDAKRSKPDHEVWVLKCSNATYKISRFPDMAAKVERLR